MSFQRPSPFIGALCCLILWFMGRLLFSPNLDLQAKLAVLVVGVALSLCSLVFDYYHQERKEQAEPWSEEV